MNDGKHPLLSKTIYVNVLGVVAMFLQWKYGWVMDVELQATILLVVNGVLRLITNKPIKWRK